nr:MAG TPA: hypothetical protein [Caudoviricetes sp.]
MKMLSKEEYKKALDNIKLNYDAEYVNECNDEFCQAMKGYVYVIENLINEHFNPQPYKFEDLKKGMWVWDNQLKWCFEIAICKVEIKGYENLKMFKVKNYDDSLTLMIFEKNRFYPVQMANVRCER